MTKALVLIFLARSQAFTVVETTVSGGGSGEWCTIDGYDTSSWDDWYAYHHCITPSEAGSSFDGTTDCWNACNEYHPSGVEAAEYYEWPAATVLEVDDDDEAWGFSGGDATLIYACCCAAKCECTIDNNDAHYDDDPVSASYSALLLADTISGDVIDDTCVVTTSDSGRASVHAIAVLVVLVCACLKTLS